MRFMLSREEQHKTVRIWVEGLNIVEKRGVIQVTGIDGLEELLAELSHNKNIFFVTSSKTILRIICWPVIHIILQMYLILGCLLNVPQLCITEDLAPCMLR